MRTAADCRKHAEDADSLAMIVSLGSDRERLRKEAQAWRVKAEEIEDRERIWSPAERPSALSTFKRWLNPRR